MRNSRQFTLWLITILWSLLAINDVLADEFIKRDEKIVFFPTAANLNMEKNHWNVPIHGWVFEPANSTARRKAIELALSAKYGLKTTPESKPIFKDRINLLLADNERGKQITIRIAGQEHTLPHSSKNGHFKGNLQLPIANVENEMKNGSIEYQAILRDCDERRFTGQVFIVPPEGISVISDIDDTIKVTNVLERRELLKNSFYSKFTAIEGMSEYYQTLSKEQGASFHFVSSSPWHFFEPLATFAMDNGFPPAEYHLKNFRFKDSTLLNLFKKGTETKPQLIRAILKRFPKRKFILVGDSGEQDPEVYATIMKEFPEQISRSLILHANNNLADNNRLEIVFDGIPSDKWQIFSSAKELIALAKPSS